MIDSSLHYPQQLFKLMFLLLMSSPSSSSCPILFRIIILKPNHLIPLQRTANMHFYCLRGMTTLPNDIQSFSRTCFIPSSPVSPLHVFSLQLQMLSSSNAKGLPSPQICHVVWCLLYVLLFIRLRKSFPSTFVENPTPSSKPSSVTLLRSFLWQLHDQSLPTLGYLSTFYATTIFHQIQDTLLFNASQGDAK